MRFRAATWWGVEGIFAAGAPATFGGTLVAIDGTPIASGRDFSSTGELEAKGNVRVLREQEATALATVLHGKDFQVGSVTEHPFRRSPAPPFITSTLQQEAGRKLRFSSHRAMRVAQRLYEQGWITYMRTDSTTLSDEALEAARTQAASLYGDRYVPPKPRRYERRVKNAQEAHEAIRPAGESFRTTEVAARSLSGDELSLYDMIWKRTVASQMTDATGTSAQVRLVAHVDSPAAATSGSSGIEPLAGSSGIEPLAGAQVEFSASGKVITFPGFLRAYV
jgi:DNA topoisomerase-1